MLGNAQVEASDGSSYPQAAQIEYSLHVTSTNAIFTYQYAVVLQNPTYHTAIQEPKFTIYVLDSLGHQIGGTCGEYSVVAQTGLPGYTACPPSPSAYESDSVLWKNWTAVGIDLSTWIGHTIKIQFTSFDCIPGGHFGYAYIACSCGAFQLSQQCSGSSDTLIAPAGFAQYSWTSSLWSGTKTTQTVVINPVVNGDTVTCVCTAVTRCDVTLKTILSIQPVRFSVNSDSICSGGAAILIAHDSTTSPYIPYSYIWSTSQTGDTIHVSPTSSTTYTVTATASGGCNSIAYAHVKVDTVHATAGANITICPNGGTARLDASGSSGAPPLSYQWSNGIGIISNNDTVTVAPSTGTTYTVTVTTVQGCTQSSSITVSVANHLHVKVTPDTSAICSGGSVPLIATGATNYTWTPNTGLNTSVGSNVIASPTDTIMYIVTGSSSGCTADTEVYVNVAPKPIAYIDSVKKATCNLLNGSATAHGGTTYIWSNGQTTATATGLAPGLYTVTVSSSTISGCFSVDTVTIHAIPSVAIHLVSEDSVLCFGQSNGQATVSASGGDGIYFYHWNSSPVQHTSTAFNLPAGTYTVYVEDSTGCKKAITVVVNQPNQLISTISTSSPVKCYGQNNGSATVNAIGGTPSYTYDWDDAETTQIATNLPAGVHTVIVTDHNGCTSTAIDTITQPNPLGIILTADSVKCFDQPSGSITSLDTGGTPNYFYSWSNGGHVQNLVNVVAGVYTVTLTDHNGCTDVAAAVVLQPTPLTFNVASGTDTILYCGGPGTNIGSISINVVGGTYPWSYNWSNGDSTQNIMNLGGGPYTITITDHNGCTKVRTFYIPQPSPLAIHIDSLDARCKDTCDGQITSAVTGGTPFSTGNYTYSWSNGLTDENIIHLCPGIYDLTVTDSNGCKKALSTSVGIKTYVNASFTPSPTTGYAPLNVNFSYTGSTSSGNIYTWTFGDGVIDTTVSPTHLYNSVTDTTFKVCLVVSDSSCKSDTCQIINVEIHSKITVPNVFTPNGDGKNDLFMVRDTSIATFNCIIFNRWGDKIYEWSDVHKGWDGKTNSGAETPDGTYYYIITAKGYDNVTYNLHGAVTLIR